MDIWTDARKLSEVVCLVAGKTISYVKIPFNAIVICGLIQMIQFFNLILYAASGRLWKLETQISSFCSYQLHREDMISVF